MGLSIVLCQRTNMFGSVHSSLSQERYVWVSRVLYQRADMYGSPGSLIKGQICMGVHGPLSKDTYVWVSMVLYQRTHMYGSLYSLFIREMDSHDHGFCLITNCDKRDVKY